ncbi:MAG: TetR/AcrR family transcriptional regulator [Anaerolineae bacterium]
MNNDAHTSRWARHKERTHRALLQAADQLFREKDFDTVTVEEIAHAANVAKGTFFNYFETKETLLIHLLAMRIENALTNLLGVGLPAPERIRLTLKAIWDALKPYRHLVHHAVLHNVRPVRQSPDQLHKTHQALVRLIHQGQEEGSIRAEVDADAAALFLNVYFLRLCFMEYTEKDALTSWEARLERGLDIIYNGLCTS